MAYITAYTSPGVTVTENTVPSVQPLTALPQVIALVGTGQGYKTSIERFILTGTAASTLKYTGVSTASVTVKNITQSSATVAAGNYTVVQSTNPDGVAASGDEAYTIARVAPPSSAPTVTASGSGVLTGTYQYAVSFVTPGGVTGETGIGMVSSQVSVTSQLVNVLSIPVGDAGTTARYLYRAKVTGGVVGTYYRVATINDNTTTILVGGDNVSDATAASNNVTPKQGIATGDTVEVTYNYTDNNYYTPILFDNYPDVVDMYGAPFDSNGNISSQLSFAARMAFINGAQQLIGLAAATSGTNDISTALGKLLDVEEVGIVSIVSGNSSDHTSLAAHCVSAANTGLYRLGIVGQDSSNQTITAASLRSTAQAYNVENMILISPSSFNITNPVTLKPMAVGGQYMAAALLGMFAARDPQIPLTRKTVAGFLSPNETRTNADAALDASAGLCVVEYKGSVFRVRHSLTTAVTDTNKREASVVRSKYEMARQLRSSLDRTIVGMVLPVAQATSATNTAVATVLEQLVNFGVISSYRAIQSRMLASNPTTVEVRFEYTPSYPINNINVVFTINTQNGDFTLTF